MFQLDYPTTRNTLTNIMTKTEVNFLRFWNVNDQIRDRIISLSTNYHFIKLAETEEDPHTPKHRTSLPKAPGMNMKKTNELRFMHLQYVDGGSYDSIFTLVPVKMNEIFYLLVRKS